MSKNALIFIIVAFVTIYIGFKVSEFDVSIDLPKGKCWTVSVGAQCYSKAYKLSGLHEDENSGMHIGVTYKDANKVSATTNDVEILINPVAGSACQKDTIDNMTNTPSCEVTFTAGQHSITSLMRPVYDKNPDNDSDENEQIDYYKLVSNENGLLQLLAKQTQFKATLLNKKGTTETFEFNAKKPLNTLKVDTFDGSVLIRE